eukprot:1128643-Karenia_brevis.AAC.1
MQQDGVSVGARIGYQDDLYIRTSATHLVDQWALIQGAAADAGHRMQAHKQAVWMPACDDQENCELSEAAQGVLELMPRSRYGLPMLGSAAHGDLQVHVQAEGIQLKYARKRAEACMYYIDRIVDFAAANKSPDALHMAWFLLTKSAAYALSYDARLIPSDILSGISEP